MTANEPIKRKPNCSRPRVAAGEFCSAEACLIFGKLLRFIVDSRVAGSKEDAIGSIVPHYTYGETNSRNRASFYIPGVTMM